MDLQTARELNALNTNFYAHVHASFDATRQAPWPGWSLVRDVMRNTGLDQGPTLNVLDLACGNLRFERFLLDGLPHLSAWAVDNCADLAHSSPVPNVTYVELDIVGVLLDGKNLAAELAVPPCDLSVCFGFLHHVAMPEHRCAVLDALVSNTRPGGIVALSLWQLEKSPRILCKAQPMASKGDYLLGWQNEPDVRRYCHSFAEDEVDELANAVCDRAREVARFSADGKTRDLNRYLMLQRC